MNFNWADKIREMMEPQRFSRSRKEQAAINKKARRYRKKNQRRVVILNDTSNVISDEMMAEFLKFVSTAGVEVPTEGYETKIPSVEAFNRTGLKED